MQFRLTIRHCLIILAVASIACAWLGYYLRRPVYVITLKANASESSLRLCERRLGSPPTGLTAADREYLYGSDDPFKQAWTSFRPHPCGALLGSRHRALLWVEAEPGQAQQYHTVETPWGVGLACGTAELRPSDTEIKLDVIRRTERSGEYVKSWMLRQGSAPPSAAVPLSFALGSRGENEFRQYQKVRVTLFDFSTETVEDLPVVVESVAEGENYFASFQSPSKAGDYLVCIEVFGRSRGGGWEGWCRAGDSYMLRLR